MATLLLQRELTHRLPNIGDINIAKMSSNDIAKEIANRILYICDEWKANINKRVLSILLGKSERYFAHLFGDSYHYYPNLSIIIDFARLLKISPHFLFLPQCENFKSIFDNADNIVKIQKRVKSVIESQISKESNDRKLRCLKKALEIKKEETKNKK